MLDHPATRCLRNHDSLIPSRMEMTDSRKILPRKTTIDRRARGARFRTKPFSCNRRRLVKKSNPPPPETCIAAAAAGWMTGIRATYNARRLEETKETMDRVPPTLRFLGNTGCSLLEVKS